MPGRRAYRAALGGELDRLRARACSFDPVSRFLTCARTLVRRLIAHAANPRAPPRRSVPGGPRGAGSNARAFAPDRCRPRSGLGGARLPGAGREGPAGHAGPRVIAGSACTMADPAGCFTAGRFVRRPGARAAVAPVA